MEFAIVDIETTGGSIKDGGITEVAVLIHNGEEIIHTYQTLLNPERGIPTYITGLTGIDNQMVYNSPKFEDIADELWELLVGRVFVAHNVSFDFGFIRESFLRTGRELKSQKLCTVRLGRKIYPGLRSYSLGSLCENRKIPNESRHRAMGDARATAILFDGMIKERPDMVFSSLKRNSGESFLPPNFSFQRFMEIPESCGVYYMLNAKGKVIYVGKALNIKERFKGHFSGQVQPKIKQQLKDEVTDIQWNITGSEFMALLIEAMEIKRLWPKFNSSLKIPKTVWGLFTYQDGTGYLRFQIAKQTKSLRPLETFFSGEEALSFLKLGVEKYRLCSKLSGIRKVSCKLVLDPVCQGACESEEEVFEYNSRAGEFVESIKKSRGTIRVELDGRVPGEKAFCFFEGGMLVKYGFVVEGELESEKIEVVKPIPETFYILRQFFQHFTPEQVQLLPKSEQEASILSFGF